MLSNVRIGKGKSIVIDMDKEIRPMSRGRSSCGTKNNISLNSTVDNFDNKHETEVLVIEQEIEPKITRKLSISELRKLNNEEREK